MSRSTESNLRPRCLCLDIETARQDRTQLREVGVFRPDTDARERISGKAPDLVARLDRLTQDATFVLGHNIVAFDQPALALLHPDLALHRLPLVDTLELSPLAFPQNPYHRLVKDYKLCTRSRNDPVRDAELAFELFLDQHAALAERVANQPDEALCLHYLMGQENGKGVANFFATLRRALRPSLTDTQAAWQRATAGKVCITGQQHLVANWLPDPAWHKPLAYVLAWLRVAGGNSVLPAWVGHAFPQTREIIRRLRDVPCTAADCHWCRDQHDLATLLPRLFPQIVTFRAKPALADGKPLQQAIVENGFAGRSTLAILPTGGGKSLCYQLPALARFYRTGSLTVVVSPLQSLMKDQVGGLDGRGITCAAFLNNLLKPLERRTVLEKLRLGDLGLIFVAPEQFRSSTFTNALQQREIGAWVFDEAHCLSKWGHDFRPDYLYVSRFIKAWQKDHPSPVFCFTATAKPDVVQDICDHFEQRLGIALDRLEGGVERENLVYEVRAVPTAAKHPEVLRLLQQALRDPGGAIVFCARQKTVEELAAFLTQAGLDCGYFHGGMAAEHKRAVQEAFIQGDLRVITATNAFGMGVDKADVRLVIHLDTPGSLENYLQEAGRAGRDQSPAQCILLYDEADLDVQFRLLRNSRLTQHDIHAILKALRLIERKDRGEGSVVVTSGEILLEIPESPRLDPDAADADTKVRIAVAWLEEARLLQRQENQMRVYPGSLLVADLAEAQQRLEQHFSAAGAAPYLQILTLLFQAADNEGISTDELMLATGFDSKAVQAMLRELDGLGLLSNDQEIGVTFYRAPDTVDRLHGLRQLENALVSRLRELAPDADQEHWQTLHTRHLCDHLRRDAGVALEPDHLGRLLKSFAEPFGEGVGQRGLFALRPGGAEGRLIKLLRNWSSIDTIRQRRLQLAEALVAWFQSRRQGNLLLVTCKQTELEAALKADLTLQALDIQDWDTALGAALIYLDTNEVLHLSRGKSVFRAAMKIELNAEARRRQFKKSDYIELDLHYQDKIAQVHVMAEYAKLALDKARAAMDFIRDYFSLERNVFVQRYFAGRAELLEMATTESAHRRILVDLKNPDQQAIVAAPLTGNSLVLAGPGSGKTRVIVHRIAWLLRECLVLPEEILVLTYNRSAAQEVRRRLWALVGNDAAGVQALTLHGLALRLTGTSYAVAAERGETVDFSQVIKLAAQHLRLAEDRVADDRVADDAADAATARRDRLLAGLRYILVDEYQDINADHYDLISALAGRTLGHPEDRLTLLAVGDDDQNIYDYAEQGRERDDARPAESNVRFIRQFEADYQARRYHLLENYRSTGHIIACANRVISKARERMKADRAIAIDHARRSAPAGGDYARLDPITAGRVHILELPEAPAPAYSLALAELQRLMALPSAKLAAGPASWGGVAVIARHWETLEDFAMWCRRRRIPARLLRDKGYLPELHKTREGESLLALLRGNPRRSRSRLVLRAAVLSRWFARRYRCAVDTLIEHPFRAALAQFILDCEVTAPGQPRVVADLIEALYEFGSGNPTHDQLHAPLTLLTAHRAKGLEFDHVLILDGGGWNSRKDEERRLFYVAMTRARKTLTLCRSHGQRHAFIGDCQDLCIRSAPQSAVDEPALDHRLWVAQPDQVFLSWAQGFPARGRVHRAIAALQVGDPLQLRPLDNGQTGWELCNTAGDPVGRMAQKFVPPGAIIAVRVFAIVVRQAKPDERDKLQRWELVLPEIEYR